MRKKLLGLLMLLTLTLPMHLAHAQEQGTQANGSAATEGTQPGLLTPDFQQAALVLVIFVILVFILYRTAWKNVLTGLKGREARIRNDIATAEDARKKAEVALVEYNTQLSTAQANVRTMLGQAAADAEKIAAGIRLHATQEAEEIKERALRDIDNARKQALSEVYEQAANLSTTIAEKILRRNLNADDQRDLVNESLQQLQTAKV